MGIYNFQKRFVPLVESGAKTHTIRAIRKNADEPGDTIHCYTGLRQKGARLLGRFECVKVEEISIGEDGHVRIDDNWLDAEERDALAKRDGFPGGYDEMISFWVGRLPFVGNVIHWKRSA